MSLLCRCFFCFFFNDTATTEIYTLSLHDALPISARAHHAQSLGHSFDAQGAARGDRKSTRLNSSHDQISYAVLCLKKKKKQSKRRSAEICRWRIIVIAWASAPY